jgi:hypothetical protein
MTIGEGRQAALSDTSPNFGASVVRIIRMSDLRAVHIRGSRPSGYLVAMLVHQREQQLKQRSMRR